MDSATLRRIITRKFRFSSTAKLNVPWGTSVRFSRNTLAELLGELGFNKGAEIGVRVGKYSETLCKSNPKLELFSVDPWDAFHRRYPQERQDRIYEEAKERLEPYGATLIRKTSMEALADFQEAELDFVYIDGNHKFDNIVQDIIHWSFKVKKNGIIACHDYHAGEVGVMKAVEAYTHCHNIHPWYVIKDMQPTAFWVKP